MLYSDSDLQTYRPPFSVPQWFLRLSYIHTAGISCHGFSPCSKSCDFLRLRSFAPVTACIILFLWAILLQTDMALEVFLDYILLRSTSTRLYDKHCSQFCQSFSAFLLILSLGSGWFWHKIPRKRPFTNFSAVRKIVSYHDRRNSYENWTKHLSTQR